MAGFTPGPWEFESRTNSPDAVRAPDGSLLASVYGDSAESEASARLIAAAPEQHEALAELVRLVRFYYEHSAECPCELCAAAKAGESALAKARGERVSA